MKKILIGFAVLVVLVVAGLLVAPSFIDWSTYRAEIAQKVKEVTGRELTIKGKISFQLLPSPKLSVSDIHFANAVGAQNPDMVSIRQLDVRVALLPLLGGNVHVHSLHLIEPTILLEVPPNQQGNWVLSAAGEAAQNIDTPRQSGEPVFNVDEPEQNTDLPVQIDDFIIENGRLIYRDPANDIYEEVSDLNSRFALASLNGPYEASGTLNFRNLPIGFETSVGQIIHGRTASFATEVTLAHGETLARISGTVANLNEAPRLKTKLDIKGKSLAGLISAFSKEDTLPGGLDRAFKMAGDLSVSAQAVSFDGDGLDLSLGDDHGRVQLDVGLGEKKTIKADISFRKIDADHWLTTTPYQVVAPKPLPLVIEQTSRLLPQQDIAIKAPASDADATQEREKQTPAQYLIPKDVEGEVSLNVEAILLKGESVRQLQARLALIEGEVALERLSAILPGAGEFSVVGVAGERQGAVQFDGSLDLNVTHLRGALDWAGLDVSQVPHDRLQQLGLSTQISATPQTMRLVGLKAKMDGSTLSGAATIALRSRPSFGVGLVLDRFNVDAYLPQQPEATPSPGVSKKAGSTTNTAASTQTGNTASQAFDALGMLESFDANLDISLGQLTYQKRNISQAKLVATIYNGDVEIKQADVADFAGLKLGASGKIVRKDKSILTENLSINASGKDISGAAKLAGLDHVLNWKNLGSVAISATLNDNLLAPELDVSLDALGTSVILAGRADLLPLPKLDATLNAQLSDFPGLVRGLGLGYRPSGNPGKIDISTDVVYMVNEVSLNNIDGHVGKTPFSGMASYKMGQRPLLNVDVKTGVLRLDPFMTSTDKSGGTTAQRSSSSAETSSEGVGTRTEQRWSRTPIDMSALVGLDGKIVIQSEGLLYEKIKALNVTHTSEMKEGVINATDEIGNLFGGKVAALSQLTVTDALKAKTDLKVTGVDVSQALTQLGKDTNASGQFDLTTQVNTAGKSQWDFVNNLNGTSTMDLKKVSVASKGGSVLDILNFLAVLSGTNPKKGLADVTAAATFTNGVADLTKAQLSSNIASGTADGTVHLPNWTMDIAGKLNVQQNALVGLLAQKAKMKSEYPFSLRGPLDSPDVKLDTGGVASGGGLVIPLSDKLEKKGVGTLLRGLLGAGGVKTHAPANDNETVPTPTESQDGTVTPPPPPPGGTSNEQQSQPSVEEQLIKGLGQFLKNK
ncbi:MAG: AsmA family protein [Methylocystaceae bacterium]|nr:AsmA family protein [Methylocystaceae bacterium]